MNSGLELTVRAPQTRNPRFGKYRMQLIPSGFKMPCSPKLMSRSSREAPRTTSLAGDLATPLVWSLRAQIPAINPVGGTGISAAAADPAVASGLGVSTHGTYRAA